MTTLKRCLVLVGPSGVGKSSAIGEMMLRDYETFASVVSHTTRAPRPGETHGIQYRFVSRDAMIAAIDKEEFIEWAEFGGNYYGTSFAALEDVIRRGRVGVLDLDVAGVKALQARDFPATYVGLVAPSLQALYTRLESRERSSVEVKKRFDLGKDLQRELAGQTPMTLRLDHVIVNETVAQTAQKLLAIMGSPDANVNSK